MFLTGKSRFLRRRNDLSVADDRGSHVVVIRRYAENVSHWPPATPEVTPLVGRAAAASAAEPQCALPEVNGSPILPQLSWKSKEPSAASAEAAAATALLRNLGALAPPARLLENSDRDLRSGSHIPPRPRHHKAAQAHKKPSGRLGKRHARQANVVADAQAAGVVGVVDAEAIPDPAELTAYKAPHAEQPRTGSIPSLSTISKPWPSVGADRRSRTRSAPFKAIAPVTFRTSFKPWPCGRLGRDRL